VPDKHWDDPREHPELLEEIDKAASRRSIHSHPMPLTSQRSKKEGFHEGELDP